MKTDKQILTWLRHNKVALGGLTSHDVEALVTSVNLSNLINHPGANPKLFAAYRDIVEEMQPFIRGIAFHAIACELDWDHRFMIWDVARLHVDDYPNFICDGRPEIVPKIQRLTELELIAA
jgi:hypothetical protein